MNIHDIILLVAAFGPNVARQLVEILGGSQVTDEQWSAMEALNLKTHDDYIREAYERAGKVPPS